VVGLVFSGSFARFNQKRLASLPQVERYRCSTTSGPLVAAELLAGCQAFSQLGILLVVILICALLLPLPFVKDPECETAAK
jgi:hypothetical protein